MFPLKSRMKLLDAKRAQEAAEHTGEGSQCSSPRSQAAAGDQPDHGSSGSGSSRYLVISVIEARNLVAKDYDTHSSDPFVKITLGSVSKKTRAIYRNCHPLWEQKLVFPIDGLSEGEPLLVELFDKDFNSKEFLGQVMMTLGKALEMESDEAQRGSYWLVLSKKRSSDVVGGELCLGFDVSYMDQHQHNQLLCELEAGSSSESLASTLGSKALRIQLRGLNGLVASGLCAGGRDKPEQQQLSLFVKYGRVMLEKRLPPPTAPSQVAEDEPGSSGFCCDLCEVAVNEEVTIPLAAAVRATPLVARKKDELLDIKLYLKSHDTLIAKTQIPISCVPISSGMSPTAATAATAAGDDMPPTGAATPRTTHDGGHKPLETIDSVPLTSSSMPTTPRGTTCENVTAGCTPLTPNSSPLCELPGSPMTRSKSDAFGIAALNKRLGALGGWVGSSSNLSSASSSSPTAVTSLASTLTMTPPRSDSPYSQGGGAKPVVEGSLGSVTAATKGHHVHAPAGLHGRKVQGLAEMHESSMLKKPLKAIFVQPREVNRTGWVPSKPHEEGEDLGSPRAVSRSFCRTMESTVPMYCNLEVNLALAVVDQKAAVAGAAAADMPAGAAQDLCEDSVSEDEEEAAEATPIQPGPPLEMLLQDVELQGIGVNQLFKLVISADSQLMKQHTAQQEISEMLIGPWRVPPAGAGYQRVRDVSYIKRLNIPLPMAPDKCHVWEEHRVMAKEAGGWVLLMVCKNDAPKGDCFEAHVQIAAVYVDSNISRLRVSMQLNWTKNTWGKTMVQSGAETDARRGYAALVKRLALHGSSCGSVISTRSRPQGVTQVQQAAGAYAGADASAGNGGWLRLGNLELLLRVALVVVALLLVAWAVVSAGRSISAELQGLSTALRECGVSDKGPLPHARLM